MHQESIDKMSNEVIIGIIGLVSTVLTWFLSRKKYYADIETVKISNDSNAIDSMNKSLDFYKDIVEDNKKRLDDSQEQINQLLKENYQLKQDLQTLKIQVQFLMKYNCMRGDCKKRITNSDYINEDLNGDDK